MENRIKYFRKRTGLTQKSFVNSFNKWLAKRKLKPITPATFSRWENGLNNPTEKMWASLADFMNTTPIVLQGAVSNKEIILCIQKSYINEFSEKKVYEIFDPYTSSIDEIKQWQDEQKAMNDIFLCSFDVLIGWGKISLKHRRLSKETYNDFEFWEKMFGGIFTINDPVVWLITSKPVNLDYVSLLNLVANILQNYLSFLEKSSSSFKSTVSEVQNEFDNTPIPNRTSEEIKKASENRIKSKQFWDIVQKRAYKD
ncbi:helix-turn-helix transcriptional regulator [uncultured Lactobacillus sp.]|uniref:helix-turn-helix domain-containing protein n=1 Tax=uncultured Lactobacillus sp. TaxID=153152 RepID=UPI0028052066|nr:helix-turn-helix transcriptional regulator [uncultured Lactobacillus sp.]